MQLPKVICFTQAQSAVNLTHPPRNNNNNMGGGVGRLNRIGIVILLIGFINIYNIVKHGIILDLPSSYLYNLGIIYIDENNIKMVLFILILAYFIHFIHN